jgi:hypothetical protein
MSADGQYRAAIPWLEKVLDITIQRALTIPRNRFEIRISSDWLSTGSLLLTTGQ